MKRMKEKKIWFPEILPIDLDLRKKWFVEYYKPNPRTEKGVRVRVYEGINRIKTVESRLQFVNQIVKRIKREQSNSIVIEKPKVIPALSRSILSGTLKYSDNYINKCQNINPIFLFIFIFTFDNQLLN